MIYLNDREEKVIGKFIMDAEAYEKKQMLLKWEGKGSVTAVYYSFIEDENDYDMDEEAYEEFWSFVFKVTDIDANPPIEVTQDNFFCVDYRNFPDEITMCGRKIN